MLPDEESWVAIVRWFHQKVVRLTSTRVPAIKRVLGVLIGQAVVLDHECRGLKKVTPDPSKKIGGQ